MMIRKGSLVRLLKPHGSLWQGKYLSVAEKREKTLVVYVERKPNGKWSTTTVPCEDVEEVVS